jgi:hypothetical protein
MDHSGLLLGGIHVEAGLHEINLTRLAGSALARTCRLLSLPDKRLIGIWLFNPSDAWLWRKCRKRPKGAKISRKLCYCGPLAGHARAPAKYFLTKTRLEKYRRAKLPKIHMNSLYISSLKLVHRRNVGSIVGWYDPGMRVVSHVSKTLQLRRS